jgi:hypothetical protein
MYFLVRMTRFGIINCENNNAVRNTSALLDDKERGFTNSAFYVQSLH